MQDREKLFNDFPAVAKTEWMEKVRQELKDRPWEEIQWALTQTIRLDPFFHPNDQVEPAGPMSRKRATQNSWEIGEYVAVDTDLAQANRLALTALQGGADALLFQCGSRVLDGPGLEALLRDMTLSMISVHFEFTTAGAWEDSRAALEQLTDWRGSYYLAASGGGISTPSSDGPSDENIRTFVIDGRPFYQGIDHTPGELAQILQVAQTVFDQVPSAEIVAERNRQTKLILAIDTSYFLSIAKIRALRILWANFLQAYGVDPLVLSEVEAHLAPYAPDSDPHSNMIRAATQALSAAIGGADRIFVRPAAGHGGMPDDHTHRIARNVQHLLKMESHIDRVIDPAAGSYYIENLTDRLAEEAWKIFTDQK